MFFPRQPHAGELGRCSLNRRRGRVWRRPTILGVMALVATVFRGRTSLTVATVTALATLVLGACGDGGGDATATQSHDATPSTVSTTSVVQAVPSSESSASPPPVTVLALGDSFVALSSWPELYAAKVESALGRHVELDTSLARAGAGPRLDAIRDNDGAHARIRAADIIVVQPEPGFAAAPMRSYLAGTCGGVANTDCFTAAADEYRTFVTEYLDLIESLATEEAVIRIITTGTWGIDGFHPQLREEDTTKLHDLIGLVDELMAVVESEALARSIPLVDVNTAFNGPDHRQLAPDGYLRADRLHLDDAGSAVVAQLLTEAGFAPLDESSESEVEAN